ncbi:helix-turn-helix domain-containing protein [Luteithermobacter gelatinilyticus]|uniref:helix-turn-helix domain-containing protein n=1 Tax=Luteithermobacter gelatinilyticus TaxID=2582913 RepID=UPI00110662A1|nr:helix-turn-helix transcriptional regulator [Luteithermobacter gelatinilyticus]|tara:strand:- start:114 stop:479 length:366 start_codon:yes stop_codon:yes gene_type:complete
MTPFGHKVRELRRQRGVSQKQMARDLEISAAYLSALEHGHRGQPSWALVQQIITYFDLIWDDAQELEDLARLSHPKVAIDTGGLSPEATKLVNLMARNIHRLSHQEIRALLDYMEKKDSSL